MPKVEIEYADYLEQTFQAMSHGGLLLVSIDETGKPNAMTIGWGTIGVVWGKPMFVVLVRPSRYTYGLVEQTGDFTVNVPTKEMAKAVLFCGTVSGRDHDKFAEKGLTAAPSRTVKSPIIEECVIHYECKVVHKNDVLSDELTSEIISNCYPQGDFHRVYYGEILLARADEDVRDRMKGS